MIILDIDMPKSCSECQLLSEEVWCVVTGISVWQNHIDYEKERLPDCPILAEITPHIANTGEFNMRFSNHEKLNDKINEYIKYRPKRVATQEEWEKLFENTKEPPY